MELGIIHLPKLQKCSCAAWPREGAEGSSLLRLAYLKTPECSPCSWRGQEQELCLDSQLRSPHGGQLRLSSSVSLSSPPLLLCPKAFRASGRPAPWWTFTKWQMLFESLLLFPDSPSMLALDSLPPAAAGQPSLLLGGSSPAGKALSSPDWDRSHLRQRLL